MMAAQKKKLVEVFGIFELLLTQNLSLFFQSIWKTISKSKNKGRQKNISAWKWFQNLLHKTFDAIYGFGDLQSSAFIGKLSMEKYFNSLEDKSNSQEPPILAFCSVWSGRSKSFDKFFFFNFGLTGDQKSFNAACNHIFVVFLSSHYGFLNYFQWFSFFFQ